MSGADQWATLVREQEDIGVVLIVIHLCPVGEALPVLRLIVQTAQAVEY